MNTPEAMGAKGGAVTSSRKAAAARANGAKNMRNPVLEAASDDPKAEQAARIARTMSEWDIVQTEVAAMSEVPQSVISRIARNDIYGISQKRLDKVEKAVNEIAALRRMRRLASAARQSPEELEKELMRVME